MDLKMPAGLDLLDDHAVYRWVMKTARKYYGKAGIRRKLAIMTTRSEDTIRSWVSGRRKVTNPEAPKALIIPPQERGGKKTITWDDIPDVMLAMVQAVTTAVAVQLRSIRRIEKQALIAEENGKATAQGRWEHQLTLTANGIGSNATSLVKAVYPSKERDGDEGNALLKQIAEYEKELDDDTQS